MARPKRIDLSFCLYHVFSRTNSGDRAFHDSRDQNKFFEYLAKYLDLFQFRLHAYCLMSNHFHLLLESMERPDLSEFMRRQLTAYTVYFNRRHSRHGHLFQGRFKSYVVDKADYLITLSRYIHLNPAGGKHPGDVWTYEGSSLRYYIKGNEPAFLHTAELLSWFKGNRAKYADYIRDGLEEGAKPEIYQQRYIGGEEFVKRMNLRLFQMSTKGTKAQKAGVINRERINQMEKDLADRLLNQVANHFRIMPETIKTGYKAQGDIGMARTLLIGLLREKLPWSSRKIGEYMGIKRGIYDYLYKISQNKELQKIFRELLNVHHGRV